MNAARRKLLAVIQSSIEELKSQCESHASDERDYYDNMPESIQSSERGERASESADALDETVESLSSAFDSIETAMGDA